MTNDQAADPSAASKHCPLCRSGATRLLETLDAGMLAHAYLEQFGVHTDLPTHSIDYLVCTGCDLRFFSPPVSGSEQFYAQLQKIRWYYSAAKQEFGIAAAHVRPEDHVLEIGAGRGLFTNEIRCRSYTGLEYSPDAIRWAADEGVQLLPRSIEEHSRVAPGEYDVVCAFQVLEHVADPRSFLESSVQCLKSGGRLVVSVPGEDSFVRYAYCDVLNMPPHHITRWTDRSLRSIGATLGLRLIAIVPEPLGRNMRRPYASAQAKKFIGRLLGGAELRLLDPRLRSSTIRLLERACVSVIRPFLSATKSRSRRGHAVVAIFQNGEAQ